MAAGVSSGLGGLDHSLGGLGRQVQSRPPVQEFSHRPHCSSWMRRACVVYVAGPVICGLGMSEPARFVVYPKRAFGEEGFLDTSILLVLRVLYMLFHCLSKVWYSC